MVEPVGQLHRARLRRYRIASLALALVSAAPGCTGGRSTSRPPGALPKSTHYHALAAGFSELALAAHDAVYTSRDGRSWETLRTPVTHPLAVSLSGEDLYVGGAEGAFQRAGSTWTRITEGIVQALSGDTAWVLGKGLGGTGAPPDDGIAALAHTDQGVVAAGPNFGVTETVDGETWVDQQAPLRPLAVTAFGVDIIAGGADGLWRREDPRRWTKLPLDVAGPVAGIAFAQQGRWIWVLAQGGVLYRSTNEGRTWRTVSRVSAE